MSGFVNCEKCHKRLLKRLPNGLFEFRFGRRLDSKGVDKDDPPVHLYVNGSIKIKCLREGCGHWNIFTFFPNTEFQEEQSDIRIEQTTNKISE
jgi:hypothetical protein